MPDCGRKYFAACGWISRPLPAGGGRDGFSGVVPRDARGRRLLPAGPRSGPRACPRDTPVLALVSDDERLYKTASERQAEAERDPVLRFPKLLIDEGIL